MGAMERTRMNTKRSVTWGLLAGVAACVAALGTPGCELLVNFDRSKIPDDGSVGDDGSELPDAPASGDGAADAGPTAEAGPDASTLDGSVDAADGAASADTGAADTGAADTGVADTGTDAPSEVDAGDAGVALDAGDA